MAQSVARVLTDVGRGIAERLNVVVLHGDAEQDMVLAAISAALANMGIRTADGPKVLRVEKGDVPIGLASLLTSEEMRDAAAHGFASQSSPPCCGGCDALPETIGVRQLPARDSKCSGDRAVEVEILFERGTALPAQHQQEVRWGGKPGVAGDVDIEVLQRRSGGGDWQRCLTQPGVLTAPGDDGEDYPCESATMAFSVESNGLLNCRVDDVRSVAFERAASRRRWRNRLVGLGIVVLLATAAWAAIAGFAGPGGRSVGASLRPRLTAFLREHNPSKLPEIDHWLVKYRGREALLIQRLEKKYGAQMGINFDEL